MLEKKLILPASVVLLGLALGVAAPHGNASARRLASPPDTVTRGMRQAFERLPLPLEQNLGQTDPEVRFLARCRGYTAFLMPAQVTFALEPAERGADAVHEADEKRCYRRFGHRPAHIDDVDFFFFAKT